MAALSDHPYTFTLRVAAHSLDHTFTISKHWRCLNFYTRVRGSMAMTDWDAQTIGAFSSSGIII
jgi:hypothetical protein